MDQVTVDYPARPGIIRDVSLNLPAGSFTFVTGPSGAGKTTLLKLMFLGLKPSAGRLQIFGRNAYDLSRDQKAYVRSRLGVVFQDFRLIDHMSIYDNVALPLRVTGKDVKSERDYVQELLYWVGLGDYANAKPEELSGGQKQRAAIARAVINRPALLLADEPTGNVDDGIGLKLIRLFEELNKLGTTVVVATHSESLLQRFEYPAIRLDGGRLAVRERDVA
ncbi:ATP-binding cassette domain-containing protein [Alphaproteobacteria bacterium]|jgi:cell division transport system ATP-binding protein|nr:ATP-binding cassette domain-containing protein [Alphaproteobacteria bacterium]MDG1416062.1 ATP-binding cassette domain-containing protein [Alphaproteobacteria bacterium]